MFILENSKLLIQIDNCRGAKVIQFLDKATGKDWVWKPSDNKIQTGIDTLNLEAGFDDHWTGGFEEVFPNDAPTEVESFRLVDHGELWRRSWELIRSNEQEICFTLNCETYPMSVTKTFTLDTNSSELNIHYEIESRASKRLPFIFKLHPALSIEPGDEFQMPNAKMAPVAMEFSRLLGKNDSAIYKALPNDGYSREFTILSELDGGNCSIYNPRTNSKLTLNFPINILPQLWLFQSYGGFRNHYVSMVEPTNAGHYDLAYANENNLCGHLDPLAKINFDIKIKNEHVK